MGEGDEFDKESVELGEVGVVKGCVSDNLPGEREELVVGGLVDDVDEMGVEGNGGEDLGVVWVRGGVH